MAETPREAPAPAARAGAVQGGEVLEHVGWQVLQRLRRDMEICEVPAKPHPGDDGVMAVCIEAPEAYVPAPAHGPSVFLAGGISACPDWQSEVVTGLADDQVTLLNPRRASFDLSDSSASEEQISWEVTHRRHPALSAMLFWFPACDPAITVQPITLLELGEALARPELPLCIGTDPHYPRRDDVVLQCRYTRPDVTVWSSLPDTVAALRGLLKLDR